MIASNMKHASGGRLSVIAFTVLHFLLKLMKQKGVYPYDYKDSFDSFSEKK